MHRTYLYGGVGNQLFQYFLLYGQSDCFEVSELFLKNYRTHNSHIAELLHINKFHRPSRTGSKFENLSDNTKRYMIRILCKMHLSSVVGLKTDGSKQLFDTADRGFFGYWHDLKFFEGNRDEIKNADWKHDAQFLNSNNRLEVLSDNTCVIHIRKGDYLLGKNKKIFANLGDKFYIDGLKQHDKPIDNLIICTDDRNWVKSNLFNKLLPLYHNVVMSSDYGCSSWVDDFLLMRFSKNLIMSNSTFSWWAAFLNDNNVYYPRSWYIDSEFNMKRVSWKYFGALS